jgi:titin
VIWTRPGDGGATITSYDLRYILESEDETDDANWTERDSVWTSGSLQYTLSGLANGTQYDVQMRAVNAAGDGAWSDTRQGTPETVPEAPTVDSLEAGDETLKVTWSSPTDLGGGTLESYNLRHIRNDATDKSDETGTWTTEPGVGSLTNREHTIPDLPNGILYDVQLQAVTSVAPGPWSGTSSGTPRTTPGAVGAPSLAPGNQSLTVSWSVPSDDGGAAPTSYDLRYILSSAPATDKDDDTKWTEDDDVGTSSSLQEAISGLENGTGYDVQVRAVNDAGEGDWSASSSATPRTTPSAPAIDTVTSGSGQLTVAWGTSSDNGGDAVTSYDLRYIQREATDKADNFWREQAGVGNLNSRVTSVSSLSNGTEYEVQVRAVNGAGGGAWSGSGSGTPAATGAPTNIQLTPSRTSITVTWDAPAEVAGVTISGYQVRYIRTDASDKSSNWNLFNINGNPPAETKTISGLSSGVEYDVQVRSKTDTGHGAWSTIESVTTTGGTSGSNRPVSPPRPPPPPPPARATCWKTTSWAT